MVYRYLEHMTDAFIEVKGNNLEDAFQNAGVSVVDTILNIKSVEPIIEKKIEIHADDLKGLLYSWLEEVIVLTITDGFATSIFNVKINRNQKYHLMATMKGEEINFEKHHFKLEIKSPTYHLMEIIEGSSTVMRFILDL